MPFETEYSNFPKEKIKLHHFKNMDDNVASIVKEINLLRSRGHHDQAAELIKSTKNTPNDLSQYIVDATTFRTWEEEIYNTQIYAKQKQQFIYFDKEEPDALRSDVWISDTDMAPVPVPPVKDTDSVHVYTKICPLSDGIWEGAVLSDEKYVKLCSRNTTSTWTYHHNLGMDVEKISSISGIIYPDNDYNFNVETFETIDFSTTRFSKPLYTPSLSVCGVNGVSDSGMDAPASGGGIVNPKLGYVYVSSRFTDNTALSSNLTPACFMKLYAYPDYIKFEFTYEAKQDDQLSNTLRIPDMAIQMRSASPVLSFAFSYTD